MTGSALESHLQRGLQLIEAGRLEDAVFEYSKAIALEPRSIGAHYLRGKVFEGLADLAAAVSDFTIVIDNFDATRLSDVELADAYFRRAHCLEASENIAEALADYAKAIEISPSWDHFSFRARLLLSLNRNEEAVADLDESIKLAAPQLPLDFYNRGLARLRLGQFRESYGDLKKYMELNPSDQRAYPVLAQTALQMGMDENRPEGSSARQYFREAVNACDEALKSDAESASCHSIRANAYNYLGDFKEAKDAFDRSIAIDPTRPQAYYLRALCCMNLKDLHGARADLSKAAEIFLEQGNDKWHQTCTQFLTELEAQMAGS